MAILFYEDWFSHPSAIADFQTSNASFIRLAGVLKTMGIKNHLFPLQLLNPELQGVDPYNPDLTELQILQIAEECKLNIFYYFREVVRDPKGSIYNPLKFQANRANISAIWLFWNHVMNFLIQPRQTGKSFTIDGLNVGLMNVYCSDTNINLFTKDDGLRVATLERIKHQEQSLPWYLCQRRKGEKANTEEICVDKLGNKYTGHVPKKSPKDAANQGRGHVGPIIHIDEAPFQPNIGISYPALTPLITAAMEIAKSKDEPYGIIVTTTAGKKDDKDGRYIYDMLMESAIWTELFYDSQNAEALNKMIRRHAPKGVLRVNSTFNHRQLGKSDEWLRNILELTNSTGEDAKRDYFCVWTSGTQLSPLSPELNDVIRDSIRDDYYNDLHKGYITRWYIPESQIEFRMNSSQYIMGLDTSDASGQDDIGLVIRDVKTGSVVAAGNYNETNLQEFANWLCDWMVRYRNVTLIIERKSSGVAIVDILLYILPSKGIDPFTRIYNTVVQNAEAQPDRYKEINRPLYTRDPQVYVKYKKHFGFATSGAGETSRSDLYGNTLLSAAKTTGVGVHDPMLASQILGLIVKNGRVDHSSGQHDDMCIAWLLSYWLMYRGKNLQHYGISPRLVLADNVSTKEERDPIKLYTKRISDNNKLLIEELSERIRVEKDDIVASAYERQLSVAYRNISGDDREVLSLSELIDGLRTQRKNKFKRR